MKFSRRVLMMGAALGLAGCASKFKSYRGPEVTRIQVFKGARIMQLLSGSTVLKSYNFELGFAPAEHKQIEGDGRTPEGAYYIDRRNPNSRYHLSLGISYPNINDINNARAMGKQPGGEIFIHGTPSLYAGQDDWTWGCIAVTNADIEEIYAMVNDGTKIFIYP
ncbi:MAG: L,D-transpeptidase family protein [Yoonia sp.]|nr:L,D-transpeptidase family protein [Yoonia sp.]